MAIDVLFFIMVLNNHFIRFDVLCQYNIDVEV